VAKASLRLWWLGLLAGASFAVTGPTECPAQNPFPIVRQQPMYAPGAKPEGSNSLSSSVKKGLSKLTDMVTPKPPAEPADDPISLASDGKPGVELHVAVARLYAESGKPAEAADHYQKALKQEPNNLAALLGYALLKDRLGASAEAKQLYLQAVEAHPKQAAAHNNLALFYAEHGMLDESVAALSRAIQLQPKNPKYRNNLAAVLVRMKRPGEAFAHLSAVHRPAVAHYNLGYLLEADSSLVAARLGLERLQRLSRAQPPTDSPEGRVRLGSRRLPGSEHDPLHKALDAGQGLPARQPQVARGATDRLGIPATEEPNEVAPLPPSPSTLMRLPPTSQGEATDPTQGPQPPGSGASSGAAIPATRGDQPAGDTPTPAAPIPSQTDIGPALQHLPRVD
jgi:hypothetical protein